MPGQDQPLMVGRGAGYSRDRSGDHSVEHLKTFAGILQADIYAGFNRLYVAGRSPGPVIGGACWAHSRRKFYELADIAASRRRGKTAPQISPLALEAVQRIDVLFDIERGINGKSAGERLAMRQELSTPVLADLNNWMQAERAKLSRHSSVAKAMDYTGSTLTGAAPGLAWKVIALSLILSALGHVAFGPLDLTPVNLALALFLRIAS